MNDPINFDIETLVARYELHPERQDVFVEGECDQGVVRAFLERQGCASVSVFSISVVNIPAATILANSLPHPSRRSDVVALAKELADKGVPSRQAVCIADSDFDQVLPRNLQCALLLFTDFASMETYACSAEIMKFILTIVSPGSRVTGTNLIAGLVGPLEVLFSARATSLDLQLNLMWIKSIEKFFSIKNGDIHFDEKEFLRRYVVIRVSPDLLEKFDTRFRQILSLLVPDIRSKIRGRDFVQVLTWFLRRKEKCSHLNEDSVRQMLYIALSAEDLAKHSMFSSLLGRIRS
jgi:hypothetical protein